MACINWNIKEHKDLEEYFGRSLASSLIRNNDMKPLSLEDAAKMIKANKVLQFRKALNYLRSVTNTSVDDLLDAMPRIIQKKGNDMYVLNGSRLGEKPAVGAKLNVEEANVNFLKKVNEQFGSIFNISKEFGLTKDQINEAHSFAKELLDQNTIPGGYIEMAKSDPVEFFKFVADQSRSTEKATIDSLGQTIVDYAKELFPLEKSVVTEDKTNLEEQAKLHTENEGSTFLNGKNVSGSDHTALSLFPERTESIEGKDITESQLEDFKKKNEDILKGNEDILGIGTWYDKSTNKSVLDISTVFPNENIDKAKELGKEYNQKSIFNLKTFEEIPTEGTGETVSNVKPESDRIKDIRAFLGKENIVEKPKTKITEGTYKVSIDESKLADLVDENKKNPQEVPFEKEIPNEQYQKATHSEYEWESEQKKRFTIDNMVNMLKNKFKIPFEYVNDKSLKWAGKFKDGKIVLNLANIDPWTPFHELFHAFSDVMKKDNSELYNSLIDELKNSEEGKAELERVKKEYPELGEKDQEDEALVSLLGKKSSANAMESKPIFQKFVDWIKGILAQLGIATKQFKTNMTMTEVANLINDPLYRYDFSNNMDKIDMFERLQTVANKNYSTTLKYNTLIDDTIKKLRADASIPGKTPEERQRKYFSKLQAEALSINKQDIEALDKFMMSSVVNIKELNKRFEEFKNIYDGKIKKTKQDIDKMASLLRETNDHIALYGDVQKLVNAATKMFEGDEDVEDNFSNFRANVKAQENLLDSYQEYGAKLISDWIYPYQEKAVKAAIARNDLYSVVSEQVYKDVKKVLNDQGITDNGIIMEQAVKEEMKKRLLVANKDATLVTMGLGGLFSSRDPIAASIALAIGAEHFKALKAGSIIKEKLKNLMKSVRGTVLFDTTASAKEFHKKYVRTVKSWEYQGLDKDLNEKYKYVDRVGFHEEYEWDTFYNTKREDFEKMLKPFGGKVPSKNDIGNYTKYKEARQKWFDENTIATKDKNGKDAYIPSAKYKNATFEALKNDKYFSTMYNTYKQANEKLGNQGLRYGIVPQDRIAKLTKESLKPKNVVSNIKKGLGEEEQVYFAQNINGSEKQSIPIGFTNLLDEGELNYNFLDSVSKFAISAEHYNAMRNIEPHVEVLKNFIKGNASLKIDPRKAFRSSKGGIKSLIKGERTAMPVEAKNLNKQVDAWVNDVVYGHTMIKDVLLRYDAEYDVLKKGETMPTKIRGFENLAQHLNLPNLDYKGFELNKDRQLGDHTVKMTKKDWNISANKASNKLGFLTALSTMGLNPIGAFTHFLRYKSYIYSEAAGGKFYSLKDAMAADAEYTKALIKGDFFEDIRGGKPSFLSSMLIDYDAINGEMQTHLGKPLTRGVANKLFRRDSFFLMYNGADHQAQTSLMIAMMKGQKVRLNNGTEISLYDAKRQAHEGTLKMSDTNWTEENDNQFRNNLAEVNNRIYGNFSKVDRAMLQRTWWGSQLMMFRKHIYNGFANRYRKGYVNYQSGEYTEGYYRTFYDSMTKTLRNVLLEGKLKWGTYTPDEKIAFRKIVADTAMLGGLIAAFMLLDDDNKENGFNDSMALVSRRLLSESVQYTPPGTLEFLKNVTNPSVSVGTVQNLYKALVQTVKSPDEQYTRNGPGYNEGDNKALKYWGRTIPLYRSYINATEPERLLEFYHDAWFFKPSAKGTQSNPSDQ